MKVDLEKIEIKDDDLFYDGELCELECIYQRESLSVFRIYTNVIKEGDEWFYKGYLYTDHIDGEDNPIHTFYSSKLANKPFISGKILKIEKKIEQPIEEKKSRCPFRSKEQHIEAVNRRLEERSRNLDMCDFIRYMKG